MVTMQTGINMGEQRLIRTRGPSAGSDTQLDKLAAHFRMSRPAFELALSAVVKMQRELAILRGE